MKKSVAAFLKGIILGASIVIFVVGVSGCQKKEGPMEKAGKAIDKGLDATKDAVKDAADKVEKKARE